MLIPQLELNKSVFLQTQNCGLNTAPETLQQQRQRGLKLLHETKSTGRAGHAAAGAAQAKSCLQAAGPGEHHKGSAYLAPWGTGCGQKRLFTSPGTAMAAGISRRNAHHGGRSCKAKHE